jgi:hypothetical protein
VQALKAAARLGLLESLQNADGVSEALYARLEKDHDYFGAFIWIIYEGGKANCGR